MSSHLKMSDCQFGGRELTREELLALIDVLRRRAAAWEATARHVLTENDAVVAALAAERTARRKWELRLRWRRSHPAHTASDDRLTERSFTMGGPRKLRSWPIAGPRGVLP